MTKEHDSDHNDAMFFNPITNISHINKAADTITNNGDFNVVNNKVYC